MIDPHYRDADFDADADAEAVARTLAHYAALSAATPPPRARDIAYGSHPDQRLDIYVPAGRATQTVIFFHGGWWKSGTKEARAFLAAPFLAAGAAFVNVEYPLAPGTPLDAITASAEAAVGWTYREVAAVGGHSSRIIVTGNSAGAHLAACAASLESLQRQSVPADVVSKLIGLSGLYDLSPLKTLFPRAWIAFSDLVVGSCSPIRRHFSSKVEIGLYAGRNEPRGFCDQAATFAAHLLEQRITASSTIVDGEDHLSLISRLPEFVIA